MPAALTRMPSGPSSRTAPPMAASTSLQRLTSAWMNVARPPALVMATAVSLPPSGSRSTTATGAPALASAVAMPRPRPEPPPVTTAQPGTSALTPPTPATWSRMIPLSLRPPDGGGIAALGSFAMARINFRFRRWVSGLTLFTYVIPSSFLSIPFFRMMADYDLIDTKLAVVLAMATFASPYALWVLSDYARSLPPEIEEAGAIDGAGILATFVHLYLPLIRPPLIAIGTYAFLYAWNEYLYALLLLTGERNIPLPVAMSNFLTTDNAPWNLLMAVSTGYSIPPVVLYYCFKRYLVSGLVSGAVSGT